MSRALGVITPEQWMFVVIGMKLTASRKCCDCAHWCFSPLFWDAAFVSPLTEILELQDKEYHFELLPRNSPPDLYNVFTEFPHVNTVVMEL